MVCIATVRRSATMLPIYHPSRRGKPDAGFALFEGECLKWPGFVEFDDVNGKVLAFSLLWLRLLRRGYTGTSSDYTSTVYDDHAYQVLTYSANDKTYRVWDMTNYDELYQLPEDEITEIKISPGIMLLILSRRDGHVPLKVLAFT